MRRSLLLFLLTLGGLLAGCSPADQPPPIPDKPIAKIPVKVGAKQFPEQEILAQVIAGLLNGTGRFEAEVKGPYPTTKLIHEALVAGDIDVYVEYSGTANEAILGLRPLADPAMDAERLRKFYEEKFKADWLDPLGFDNTFVFVVKADGPLAALQDFSGLAPQAIELNAGLGAEFATRPDGYPLLQDKYGMVFHDVKTVSGDAAYQALDAGEVATIAANSTDGQLTETRYHMLEDNLHVLPTYAAVPVLRYQSEAVSPGLKDVLVNLGGKISTATMRKLNAEVSAGGKTPAEVAAAFVEGNREYLLAPSQESPGPAAVDLAPAKDFAETPAQDSPGTGEAAPIAPAQTTPPSEPAAPSTGQP